MQTRSEHEVLGDGYAHVPMPLQARRRTFSVSMVARMPHAVCNQIPGVWGHFAGGGASPADTRFIDNNLKSLLAG